MVAKIPSRGSEQFVVRLPDGMRDKIKAAADASGRSMNSEIVARLERAFSHDFSSERDLVVHIILDADGMPTSWGEVAAHLSKLGRLADLSTAKVEFNVITPEMREMRMDKLLALLDGYDKLIKDRDARKGGADGQDFKNGGIK